MSADMQPGYFSPEARAARRREALEALRRQTWRKRLADVSRAVGTASASGRSVAYELAAIAEESQFN